MPTGGGDYQPLVSHAVDLSPRRNRVPVRRILSRTSYWSSGPVILCPYAQRTELLEMAEVTRSLLSLTAVSGNPTTAILSVFPQPAWTSISTSKASTPTTAAEYTFDGITERETVLL